MIGTQINMLNPYLEKLEIRPKHIIAHEYGAGSRCLNCNCPGLDLHFWRKICKTCSCRMDEHDVVMPSNFDHGAHIKKLLIDQSNSQPSRDSENFINLRKKIGTAIFHKKEHSLDNSSTNTSIPPTPINLNNSRDTHKESLYGVSFINMFFLNKKLFLENKKK